MLSVTRRRAVNLQTTMGIVTLQAMRNKGLKVKAIGIGIYLDGTQMRYHNG